MLHLIRQTEGPNCRKQIACVNGQTFNQTANNRQKFKCPQVSNKWKSEKLGHLSGVYTGEKMLSGVYTGNETLHVVAITSSGNLKRWENFY